MYFNGLRGPAGIPGPPGLPGSCVRSAPPTPLPPQYFAYQVNKVLKEIKGTTETVDYRAPLGCEETEAHDEIGVTKAPWEKG